MSIFKNAKKKPTKKKATKEKVQVIPKFETKEEASEYSENLSNLATLKTKINKLTAEYKTIESGIKSIGVDEFANLLEKTGKRETSYHLTSENGACVMVTVQDKYISIDEERAEYLNETYGTYDDKGELTDSIVDEQTEFKFNLKVLEKYQDVISDLIENCEDMAQEDKDNLIECVTKYSIKKGAIDSIYKLSKEKGVDIHTLIEEINPVVGLKASKIN